MIPVADETSSSARFTGIADGSSAGDAGIGPSLGQVYRAYEQLEGLASSALEQLVATNGFADLMATSATNAMALTRLVNERVDQAVRATRLASRRDVVDLARQLGRTEDKLERLLQAVEKLQSRLDEGPDDVEEKAVSSVTPPGSRPVNGTARKGRARSATGREGTT